ncbi:MAG: hypothetical protein ABSF55_03115 [Candidatus Staskawiczbacteria bacterium]|jgi:hypothetical protein
MSHLYKIKNKNKELIRFNPNKAQRDFDNKKWNRNIILKSRQLGFTTFETIDGLDDALFTPNHDGLFIAQDLQTAQDIFNNKVELAWENFPLELKPLWQVDKNSVRKLKFAFGDGSYSSLTVDSTGRSGTYHRLHITEFAKVEKDFPQKAREILEGSIPAIPTNGRIDIESTADGSDGKFYNMFWEAWERGEPKLPTEYKAHFYSWLWDEEIDDIKPVQELPIEFREYQKLNNLTDKQITYYYFKWLALNKDWSALRKEFPTTPHEAFLSSGNKLFDNLKLAEFKTREGRRENDWVFYDEYIPKHRYAIGADVAEGVGQDSSTAIIWDFTNAKPVVVARYASNKIAPDIFAFELRRGGEKFGTCLIAVERNNHGHATIAKLKEIYPVGEIYRDEKDRLGWETNLVSKPKMMYDLSTAVNDNLIDIPDNALISEMRRYDKENLNTQRFDEEATQHYDILMAAAIGFQMKNEDSKFSFSFGDKVFDADNADKYKKTANLQSKGVVSTPMTDLLPWKNEEERLRLEKEEVLRQAKESERRDRPYWFS